MNHFYNFKLAFHALLARGQRDFDFKCSKFILENAVLLKRYPVSSIAALSALLFTQSVWAADTLTDALTGGKASANLQYRYEGVSQVGKLTANASTVRLRLGYETGTFNGFGAMIEAETLKTLGGDNYDSKANGLTQYATVADPEATEVNQAYLSFSGVANTNAKWGRQRIKLDNDRFIGNVGWRQNEQTFDSFTLVNKSLPSTTLTAGYITNVNRVFSDNSLTPTVFTTAGNAKMRSPIFNVNYKGWSFAEVVGYAYLLDYTDTDDKFNLFSTDTYGLRLNGSAPMGGNKLLYTAEFASQSDGGNNTVNYKTNYTFLEGGIDITSAVFKLGYEVLGTDTGANTKGTTTIVQKSFSTPLATLHSFNGWADMFLTTPAQGLKDTYVSAGTKLAGFNLEAVYHDYRADKTTVIQISNFGTEWNLMATKAFGKNYTIGLKYADYKAKGIAATTFATNVNTKKTWLWCEFKF
ncbi:MAG: alginate export family protein [Nitrosomonadales bacterium]|nr:alginate export family protein [Nitrosomonadales bacterium]